MMEDRQRKAAKLRRMIRHYAYIVSRKSLGLIMAAADGDPPISLDELLADIQDNVNNIAANIAALSEVE